MRSIVGAVEATQAALEGLSIQGRLLVTGITVVTTVGLVYFLLPVVGRWAAALVDRKIPEGRLRDVGERLSDYVPTTLGVLSTRAIQLGVVVLAGVSIVAVWGQLDRAEQVVSAAGITPNFFMQLAITISIVFSAYLASSILTETVRSYGEGAQEITEHQQEIVIRLGNVGIFVLAITGTLTLWGQDLSGLLVGAGFLGVVVGIAARQSLGSLIAGFVLMFSQPFTIGDWVEIDDEQGIVTKISIMNTRLKNFDGETIVIPNDSVTSAAITNRSERGHLRIRLDVGIDYETDPGHAEDIALATMQEIKAVADSPPPEVVPKQFGDSAVILELRFWIDRPTPPARWRATSRVVEAVKQAFEEEGITIPFPQRQFSNRASGRDGPSGFDRPTGEVEPGPQPES
jgi:small-conductance mechanosensitive channel